MIVLGLTGSIAMGKSEAARMLQRRHIPVFESDAAVHRLMGPGGAAVAAVTAAFPGVGRDGAVDRAALGAQAFGDADALARLEAILHPRVRAAQRKFLWLAAARRERLAVLDIPLLFETGAQARLDAVAVVSAPLFIQRRRALARQGMTDARFAGIRAKQMADADKRRQADFILPSGHGKRAMLREIIKMLRSLDDWPARAWPWPP